MTALVAPLTINEPQTRAADPHAWPARANLAGWVIVAVGAIYRIARFAHWRALWLDEIYLAHSIVSRGYHDLLFRTLDYWQAAPPGFLLLTRVSVSLFGPGERSLRLTSLIFGLMALPLFFGIVRRCLPPRAGLIAMGIFSVLGPLIYYSNELKQYSCDVAVTLAIILAMMRWMDRPDLWRSIVAAATGAAGLFFSHPSMFVLAGVGTTAIVFALRERDKQKITSLLVIFAVWLVAFRDDYNLFLVLLAKGQARPHLVEYWVKRDAFMPINPVWGIPWLFGRLWTICIDSGAMWISYPDVAAFTILVGFAAIKSRPRRYVMLLSALPFALIASATKKYPFGDRLVLYVVPMLIVLMAAGIELLWRGTPRGVGGTLVVLLVLFPSFNRATGFLFHPPGREESLSAYQFIAHHWQPGDTIYLSHYADVSWAYYAPHAGFTEDPAKFGDVQIQANYDDDPRGYIDEVKRFTGRKRVWAVFDHTANGTGLDAESAAVMGLDEIGQPDRPPHLDANGKQIKAPTFSSDGVDVYLYDCAAKPLPARLKP